MTIAAIVALLLFGGGDPDAVLIAQLTIRRHAIIRVPTRDQPPREPQRWNERNGPKCIPVGGLAGAMVSREGIDLLLRGGARIRARLRRCAPLDYHSGFYVRPGRDGRVCADRDTIRVRSGGSCEIDVFKRLVPRPAG